MNIEQYISQLLYRHQCVVVPGFGAFLTHIESTKIVDEKSFIPPRKLVSFNPYLKNNDGLLAHYIAGFEKISYNDAVSKIEIEINFWKKTLENNSKFFLKSIGEFHTNQEQNIVFTPNNQINFLTTSFGLSGYISPLMLRETKVPEVFETEKPVFDLVINKNKNYSYLKYAAILILGLSASGFGGIQWYNKQVENQTLLVEKDVQKQVNNKIQEATFFIKATLPQVTLTVKSQKMPYHIVAGAFKNQNNANKQVAQLIKLGYLARRIEANRHGLFPVIYGSFASLGEAQQAMAHIKKVNNSDAWLLVEDL